ncbi:MAG: Rieske (2Fe-2S) protein, partial [Luminiphilus sp.]
MLDTLERTLPRESYLSEEAFDLEYRAIFESDWVCIGRSESLPSPGDYLAIRLKEQSLLVVRGEGGNLAAFFNVCRHRGTELVALPDPGPVTGTFERNIVCPYHAWTYHLDGRLRGTPHLDIATDGVELHHLPLEEWGGFLFVHLGTDAPSPLLHTLGPGTGRLQNYP